MAEEIEFRFGSFRLLRGSRLLLKAGEPVRMGSRAFDLLVVLLERAGQVVGKGELLRQVWPDGSAAETSLRFHIATLRRVLGEERAGPRYIAGINGRGYCFVAEVGRTGFSEAVAADAQPGPSHGLGRGNIPAGLAKVFGRDALVAQLRSLVPARRLTSITGAAGMGKSTVARRLAEQLAEHYPAGIWFVDLAAVTDPDSVPGVIAATLGVAVDPNGAAEHLFKVLGERRLLIVLDNCEHLAPAVGALLRALVEGLPQAGFLVTSREALQIPEEHVEPLGPLACPAPGGARNAAEALRFAAVELFVDRAAACVEGFALADEDAETVAEICRRLDGLPFVIELVAARIDSFAIQALLSQLEQRLPLHVDGRRGVAARHRTLRSLLDWSYQHLTAAQQCLLRTASVFSGAFDVAAVSCLLACSAGERAATAENLAALARRSLVSADGNRDGHYRLLLTTRMYALERLEQSPEYPEVRGRHVRYLCERLRPLAHDWVGLTRQALMDRYAHLDDEIRAALRWCLHAQGEVLAGARLLAAAAPLAHLLAHADEFIAHIEWTVERLAAMDEKHPTLEYELWLYLSSLKLHFRGAFAGAAYAVHRAQSLAGAIDRPDAQRKQQLLGLAGAFGAGEYADAEAMRIAADLDPVAEPVDHMAATRMLMLFRHYAGRHDDALRLASAIAAAAPGVRRVGPGLTYDQRVSLNIVLARIHWLKGELAAAAAAVEAALDIAANEIPSALVHVLAWAAAPIALWQGDDASAHLHIERLRKFAAHHRLQHWVDWATVLADVLQKRASPGLAAVAYSPPLTSASDSPKLCDLLATLGPAFLLEKSIRRAAQGLAGWCEPEVLRGLGVRHALSGRPDAQQQAQASFLQALALAGQGGALAWQLRAATSLAQLQLRQGAQPASLGVLESLVLRYPREARTRDLDLARQVLQGVVAIDFT